MKNDRHARVEINCEICGNPKMVRVERVEQGMGRYCSKECSHEGRRRQEQLKWGRKDLARKYKTGNKYVARWYDENGKTCSTTYGKWWWEMNNGEIPDGMVVMHKDNNPLNISPSNFILGTYKEMTDKGKATLKNDPQKWSHFLNEQSKKMSKLWDENKFKNVVGENHWKWRGGLGSEYPKSFSKSLKQFIKTRDNYQCQVCSRKLYKSKSAHVHHRDRNRQNNDQDNLILLCVPCHNNVHGNKMESPPIMALRSEFQ